MAVELYPHQKEAVEKLSSGKILWGGVGSGKSITAASYYMKHEAPKRRDVYVITTARKRDSLDWEKEFIKFGVGNERGPYCGKLSVDSWNNISRYKNVMNSFFIFDEQRVVGSGAWAKAFEFIAQPQNKNTWILLTATPGDVWLDYMSVFIANGFYKNRTEFKDQHVEYDPYAKFPKVKKYHNVEKLKKLRALLLVHMPFERHTIRIMKKIHVEYDRELMNQVMKERWNPYENRPIRSVPEFFYVMRKIVNSDATRLHAVKTLLKEHDRIIVFYNFSYELEKLRDLRTSVTTADSTSTTSDFVVAEWNGVKHEEVPETKKWVYLVQYTAGAEAWNCTTTNATAFYSLTYSYRQWHQAHGRVDRLNTPFKELLYYTLFSEADIDSAIMDCLSRKRSFNEVEFKKRFGSFKTSV